MAEGVIICAGIGYALSFFSGSVILNLIMIGLTIFVALMIKRLCK